MTNPFHVRPCSHAHERAGRLGWLSAGLLGFTLMAIWDPTTHPGPTCCLLRIMVGLPCPLCGMTRGVAMCLRGRFLEATYYHPLAVPFVVGMLVMCVKWAVEYATARRIDLVFRGPWKAAAIAALYVGLLGSWVYLLMYRREDDFAATWVGQWMHYLWP